MKLRTLAWFKSRIGKRIFRDKDDCSCDTCANVAENGLIISDNYHARYLHMVENDWANEGVSLNYRDKL